MHLVDDWPEIRRVFARAQRSALHHSFATIGPDGRPHVSPIGSLWLQRDTPSGVYLDLFNRNLRQHLDSGSAVCIMAVDARKTAWLKALLRGRFAQHPALRLFGASGESREATDEERERFTRMFQALRFTKGHKLLWSRLARVRDVHFDRVEPVRIGQMTKDLFPT